MAGCSSPGPEMGEKKCTAVGLFPMTETEYTWDKYKHGNSITLQLENSGASTSSACAGWALVICYQSTRDICPNNQLLFSL